MAGSSTINETLELASAWLKAANMYAQVGIGKRNSWHGLQDVTIARWVGAVPLTMSMNQSKAPSVVLQKLAALIAAEQKYGMAKLLTTPVQGYKQMMKWQGGAAQYGVRIAVSKWAQEWDKLFALVLLYHVINNHCLTLHHAGASFLTKDECDAELVKHRDWIAKPADDYERHYRPWGEVGVYREVQYGLGHNGRHLDFIVDRPEDFLNWVAAAYGEEPEFFRKPGPNDTVGEFWVLDPSGKMPFSKFGIMARPHHWDVRA